MEVSTMNRYISEEDKMRANYAEYLVKRKGDKTLLFKKLGLVLLAIVILAAGYVFLISRMAAFMLPLVIGTAALVWYLWRYTNIEYEYIILSGTVEVYRIYGERVRKKILEFETKNIENVAPLEKHPDVKNATYSVVTDCSSGEKSDELYFVTYTAEHGKGILYLNVIKKTLDVFRYYKPSAVEYGNIS